MALSDPQQIIASPYTTVKTNTLNRALQELLAQEQIDTIVVGCPYTLRGTESEQTKKVKNHVDKLKQTFPSITWTLWDERLSSKRAQALKRGTSPEEKLRLHARAAAFILDSYLRAKEQ